MPVIPGLAGRTSQTKSFSSRSKAPGRSWKNCSWRSFALSLVGAGYGALLMFEGATGARYEGVVYREVWDDDAPTRVNFMAYWREANSNPTLGSFLAVLREHYLDLSAELGPT